MNHLEEGIKYFQNGQLKEATSNFEAVLNETPDHAQATFLLGVCYFRAGVLEKAMALFRKAISLNLSDYKPYYYLGLALEKTGHQREAVEAWKMSVNIYPTFKEGLEKLKNQAPMNVENTVKPIPREVVEDAERTSPGDLILDQRRWMKSYSFPFILMLLLFLGGTGMQLLFQLSLDEPGVMAIYLAIFGPALLILFFLLLKAATTRYIVYQRRIDFVNGILFRKKQSVWLFEVSETWITQTPFNLLTNDATVHFLAAHTGRAPQEFTISGIGNRKFMNKLWEEMRDAALLERRAMKKWWV